MTLAQLLDEICRLADFCDVDGCRFCIYDKEGNLVCSLYDQILKENKRAKIELGSSEWVHDILRRFGEIEIFVDIIEVVKEMNEQEETPDCLHNGPQDHELATVEKYVEWTEGVCGNCFFANGCQWYVDLFAEEYNY